METKKYLKNNGWDSIEYNFCKTNEENIELNNILNEAVHVFYHHSEGSWNSSDKDLYANKIGFFILKHPSVIKRLLASEDRIIKMLTYRAIELNQIE